MGAPIGALSGPQRDEKTMSMEKSRSPRKLLGASKVGFKVRASEHIHQDGGGIGNPRKLLSDQMGFLGSY